MAIGDTAIHAACRLFLHFLVAHPDGELAEMANPVGRRLILRRLAVDFEKTRYLTHNLLPHRITTAVPDADTISIEPLDPVEIFS
jgi:hypothetical protein